MKSRKAYNVQLKALKKMEKDHEKKYGSYLGTNTAILAFKLGYQTRIEDEFIEKMN